MEKIYLFSSDLIFNRNIDLSINKNKYIIINPNITCSMLYNYCINNNTNYIIIHSSFLHGYYNMIDLLINSKKNIIIYVSNNLEYGNLYNATTSIYFHMMDDKYLSSINEIIPLMKKYINITNSLEIEKDKYKSSILEDRLVKKAKLYLMNKYNYKEEDAYKYILKNSMDERVSKAEIAKRILKEVEK